MIVDDSLAFNLLQDLRKREVNPVMRAKFLSGYCKEMGLSHRALAKELGIPSATIHDWCSYDTVTSEEYDGLLDKGFSKKEVYRMIRDDRHNAKARVFNNLKRSEIAIQLTKVIMCLRPVINNPELDEETTGLLKELKNILNRIELHKERGK